MGMVIVDSGKLALLTSKVRFLSTLYLHLYIGPHTPAADDDLSAYVEASYPGYLPQVLASWRRPYLAVQGWAQTDHAPLSFAATGEVTPPQVVAGYYVTTEPGGGSLIAAEPMGLGGQRLAHAGDGLVISPSWTEDTDSRLV